jgi:hypothetical protein
MKKFFITLAVIMMIGLMATAAMAAQGADRNKPGGACLVDFFSATDNALQTMFAVHNILQANWVRVHVIIYDQNSFKLIDFTITLSPRDVSSFNIQSIPGSNSIRIIANSIQAGDIIPDTVPGWGTNWAAGGPKTGYITMIVSSVGQGASGPNATPPTVWSPMFSGGETVLSKGHWGIPPDCLFTTIYYLNTSELHGESINAVQFQGFENLPGVNTARYNFLRPFWSAFDVFGPGNDPNLMVAYKNVPGSIYVAGTPGGFTAANATTTGGIPTPGLNTTMFAEYQNRDANQTNIGYLDFYGGFPKSTPGAPLFQKVAALLTNAVEYTTDQLGFPESQTRMSAAKLSAFARVPGTKNFILNGGNPISSTDFFNWGGGAIGYGDNDDNTGPALDSFEMYVTDGWGNVVISSSPAGVGDGFALVPQPTLSLQAIGRWNNDVATSMTTDLITCYPASNPTSNSPMIPYNGNIKSLYYFSYNDREFGISGVVIPLEVSRITFGKQTGQIQIPLATDTQGWVWLTSGLSTGMSYRTGLPFTGFLVTFAANPAARFSALTPLIDVQSARVGNFGNGTNIILAGGGWNLAGGFPGPISGAEPLGNEDWMMINSTADTFQNAAYSTWWSPAANGGLGGQVNNPGGNAPPSKPVVNNGSVSGGTVGSTGGGDAPLKTS